MEKNDLIPAVGMRVRIQREKKCWSRERLAEYADISTQFLADIEAGKKCMTIYTLYKITRALHTSADYLLFDVDNKTDPSLILTLRDMPERDRARAEMILNAYVAGLAFKEDT